MKILLFLTTLLIAQTGFSSGVVTIDGKLRSFDQNTISIENKDFIFVIDKSKMNLAQVNLTKKIHVGSPLTLSVPFQALNAIKDINHD